jgi:hypothetical protein
MPRRANARLITGDFDLQDVSYRTQLRAPKPSAHFRQRVPPKGSATRKKILCSTLLWQGDKYGHALRPATRTCLGHNIEGCQITVKGKRRWKWAVVSIMCLGVSKLLEVARLTALEEVLGLKCSSAARCRSRQTPGGREP